MSFELKIYEKTLYGNVYYTQLDSRISRLLDAFLSGQSFANNGKNYSFSAPDSDTLRNQFEVLLANENVSYLKFLAYAAEQVMRQIRATETTKDWLHSDQRDYCTTEFWTNLLKKHDLGNGAFDPVYTVAALIEIEEHLSNIHDMIVAVHFEIAGFDETQIWQLFYAVNKLRYAYADDPAILDRATFHLD